MTTLKDILQSTMDKVDDLGGAVSPDLLPQLHAHRRSLFVASLILSIIIVIVVGVSLYLVATHIDDADRLPLLSAALGLSAGGGLEMLRRLWSEWSRTVLFIMLIEGASEPLSLAIIERAAPKLVSI